MRKCIFLLFIIMFILTCGTSRLRNGDDAMYEENYDLAIQRYQEFIDNNPDAPEVAEAREKIGLCYYRKGIVSYKKRDVEAAIANLINSKTRAAYMMLTKIYFEKGNKELKNSDYKQAIANYELAKETTEEGKCSLPSGFKEKSAEAHYLWAEQEFEAGNIAKAKELYESLFNEYDRKSFKKYPDIIYKLFQINYTENNYDAAVNYIAELTDIEPEFKFTEKDNVAFNKMLARFTQDADTEFKKKNYANALLILQKAGDLPNFDPLKQKQLKARIIFEQGKDLIKSGEFEKGLEKFKQAKEIDINIGTEVINLSKRYIKEGLSLQRKRKYDESIDKFITALKLVPDNSDITSKYLPDTYYKMAYSLFLKKDYKASLIAIKSGLKYNKEHKELNSLYKKWDDTVNALKKKTLKELIEVINFVDEQYRNAVTDEMLLGRYKNKKIKWQAKVLGMEVSGDKSYGKFQLDGKTFYGLPTEKLDAQRFAQSCEENAKKEWEAIINGKIAYVEELLGIKNLVVSIDSINFVEPLETR